MVAHALLVACEFGPPALTGKGEGGRSLVMLFFSVERFSKGGAVPLFGTLALLAFSSAVAAAFEPVRRHTWRIFHRVHTLSVSVAFVLVVLHQPAEILAEHFFRSNALQLHS